MVNLVKMDFIVEEHQRPIAIPLQRTACNLAFAEFGHVYCVEITHRCTFVHVNGCDLIERTLTVEFFGKLDTVMQRKTDGVGLLGQTLQISIAIVCISVADIGNLKI